jgi:hypothetical protein
MHLYRNKFWVTYDHLHIVGKSLNDPTKRRDNCIFHPFYNSVTWMVSPFVKWKCKYGSLEFFCNVEKQLSIPSKI